MLAAQRAVEAGFELINYLLHQFLSPDKKAINTPVIAVGLITDAQQAERILQAKQTDVISVSQEEYYMIRVGLGMQPLKHCYCTTILQLSTSRIKSSP